MAFAFVNGMQVAEEEAVVSINDRGLRFGDGVFETIGVHEGLPYLWEYHMERLKGGLHALHITCDAGALLPQAMTLLQANALTRGRLRIGISRGAGSQGYLPSGTAKPTIVMQTLGAPELPKQAVTLWLSSFEKISPQALPTQYKLAQGLGSILARMEAEEHGCFDGLQLSPGECVSEASSANIFWQSEGRLHTPSLSCGALAGVTRRRIMELSSYPVSEGVWRLDRLLAADAVIITNASLGAVAVGSLLPQGKNWESRRLAGEVTDMINKDINRYIARQRELLART